MMVAMAPAFLEPLWMRVAYTVHFAQDRVRSNGHNEKVASFYPVTTIGRFYCITLRKAISSIPCVLMSINGFHMAIPADVFVYYVTLWLTSKWATLWAIVDLPYKNHLATFRVSLWKAFRHSTWPCIPLQQSIVTSFEWVLSDQLESLLYFGCLWSQHFPEESVQEVN